MKSWHGENEQPKNQRYLEFTLGGYTVFLDDSARTANTVSFKDPDEPMSMIRWHPSGLKMAIMSWPEMAMLKSSINILRCRVRCLLVQPGVTVDEDE